MPGVSHGEWAISSIFALPRLSRLNRKLVQALLLPQSDSTYAQSGFAV